jgi:thiosulfate/3-mercaptopyruvate sulfurtransferase
MEATLEEIKAKGYARPEMLVSTAWVAEHLNDPNVRVVESDEDALLYDQGHIPGAVKIDWEGDLNDPVTRDYISSEAFGKLMGRLGIKPETTVVFYGDKSNWWAAYALWVFRLFGHKDVRLMDGGRAKWQAEKRSMTRDVPSPAKTSYPAPQRDDSKIRAFQPEVLRHVQAKGPLVDVRSPQEYSGEFFHMPDYPQEGALRAGHIPGAANIPWKRSVNDDGTFKSAEQLRALYEGEAGLKPKDDIVVYCRIGERSSHTWFVLSQLLGFDQVRNYDGSWTEWGNMVRVPIENPWREKEKS